GQLARPRMQLREQPHVLDGDDRLIRGRVEEGSLLVGKRPGRSIYVDVDGADRRSVAKHGYCQHRGKSGRYHRPYTVVTVLAEIRDVDGRPCQDRSPGRTPPTTGKREHAPQRIGVPGTEVGERFEAQQ